MKYNPESIVLLLLFVAATNCPAQIRVGSSVVASGATHAANATQNINATIGQPITSRSGSAVTKASLGFWTARSPVTNDVERVISAIPATLHLEQNFPNPANESTVVRFSIPEPRHVVLRITDALGRTLRTSVNAALSAGSYQTILTLHDLPSGSYFYQLRAGGEQQTRRLLVRR